MLTLNDNVFNSAKFAVVPICFQNFVKLVVTYVKILSRLALNIHSNFMEYVVNNHIVIDL